MWDRQKLGKLARERKAALGGLNKALLAFARTQEMTEETGIDRRKAEQDLAAALDRLEPDAVLQMKALGSVERDEVLRDFLTALTDHNQENIVRELKEVQELSEPVLEAPVLEKPENQKAASKKKRGLRMFRG
ncbi:protein of unknown function [Candidatus Filomicrobium marinum]|uniref:Uncharacterized protein n=3 Tax=Filomicrobium TaxID=119044 RepID=A0A0D6JCE4_9HYPH|nr:MULTISPECIES: hypothetical protein [Filomicrobium]CFX05434.1 protein of unknown function [Candidatus Filomicrobium marinum]CPR16241.1 protein of unknown function [Candidatus Filomicrobium marinum]SDP66698.1 hypothetical protein SAMN04488061_3669 [Filomicrobium insigne]